MRDFNKGGTGSGSCSRTVSKSRSRMSGESQCYKKNHYFEEIYLFGQAVATRVSYVPLLVYFGSMVRARPRRVAVS